MIRCQDIPKDPSGKVGQKKATGAHFSLDLKRIYSEPYNQIRGTIPHLSRQSKLGKHVEKNVDYSSVQKDGGYEAIIHG
jgi:hypothetical protein